MVDGGVAAGEASWIGSAAPAAGSRLTAKTRYRQADAQCAVAAIDGDRFTLRFDAPQWAATPGQSAVIYDGEVCLGGGVIDHAAVRQQGATPAAGSGVSAGAAG